MVKDNEMKHRSEQFMLKLNDLGFKFKDKEDLDIQAEIDRHGTDNVRIIQ